MRALVLEADLRRARMWCSERERSEQQQRQHRHCSREKAKARVSALWCARERRSLPRVARDSSRSFASPIQPPGSSASRTMRTSPIEGVLNKPRAGIDHRCATKTNLTRRGGTLSRLDSLPWMSCGGVRGESSHSTRVFKRLRSKTLKRCAVCCTVASTRKRHCKSKRISFLPSFAASTYSDTHTLSINLLLKHLCSHKPLAKQ